MRLLYTTLSVWLLAMLASANAAPEGYVLPLFTEPVIPGLPNWLPLTNSMVMVWLAVAIIIFFSRIATRKMEMIPQGMQNFVEWLVESLYNFLETLLGSHLAKRTFWFFGSVFFFILVNNLLGLIPGVGTIGWDTYNAEGVAVDYTPVLRGGSADLNLTIAMSLTFAMLWFYWAFTENGTKGFLAHIFAPKGSFSGFMLVLLVPIFIFVGLLEMISIAIRPVALSFRLYGNMYGGEQTLETLMTLVPKWLAFLPALPFYFVKILVSFVQALVFILLGAIFVKLICDHGDEHEAHH